MATGVRVACITHGGPRPRGSARAMSGYSGFEHCRHPPITACPRVPRCRWKRSVPPHNGQGMPDLALAVLTRKASSQSSSVLSRTAQLLGSQLRRRPSIRQRRPPPLIRPRITHDPARSRKVALPDKPFTFAAMESPTPSRRRRPRPKPHRMDVRRPVVRVESPHVIMLVWHRDAIVLRFSPTANTIGRDRGPLRKGVASARPRVGRATDSAPSPARSPRRDNESIMRVEEDSASVARPLSHSAVT